MQASRLEALASIAHTGTERTRAELVRERAELDVMADQHGRLCRFIEDYRATLGRSPTATGAAALAHRHRFVARLEAQAQEMWAAVDRRREAMLPVVDRHREAAAKEAALMAMFARTERVARTDRARRDASDFDAVVALRMRADHHASLAARDGSA